MFESLTRVYENKASLSAGSIKIRGGKVEHVDDLLIVPVLVSEASVFGAEVFGIDWKTPITDEKVKQVRNSIKTRQRTGLTHLTPAHQAARQIRRPHLPRNRARQ